MTNYKGVSCAFYDELTNSIVLKQKVNLKINDSTIVEGFIQDIFTRNKEEFILINAEEIRLDFITEAFFDGKPSEFINTDFCNFDS